MSCLPMVVQAFIEIGIIFRHQWHPAEKPGYQQYEQACKSCKGTYSDRTDITMMHNTKE
ncbi:MAG: hypothetical protein NT175_04215 [Bacteroidetes bacterium]|nr:hypothetical protein [Bacteroidota bacterium]